MMTPKGPRVLEYNVRFGDPETQVLLPLVKSDLALLLYESAGGALPDRVELHTDRCAATVVVASRGYPGSYEKNMPIAPLDAIDDESRVVFHAGTKRTGSGLVTSGGRVLAVTAWSRDLAGALQHAYRGRGAGPFRRGVLADRHRQAGSVIFSTAFAGGRARQSHEQKRRCFDRAGKQERRGPRRTRAQAARRAGDRLGKARALRAPPAGRAPRVRRRGGRAGDSSCSSPRRV